MLRYYEWDYDTKTVTEYARRGQCNKCGECCRWAVHYIGVKPYRARSLRNGSSGTTGEGVWQEIDCGRWSYYFSIANVEPGGECWNFDAAANLCKVHADAGRGKICTLWPFSPRCLEHFPQCGYSFEILGTWPLEETQG